MMGVKTINKSIEKVYSLTPLQEGMLFHYASNNYSLDYIVQHVYELEELEIDLVKKALKLLTVRHNTLRTSVIYENISIPKNVIVRNREIDYEFLDLSGFGEEDSQKKLIDISVLDMKKGFNLQKDSLLRITQVKISEVKHLLIWTNHHIILDGWCFSILLSDFAQYYVSLKNKLDFFEIESHIKKELQQVSDYSDYIKWIESQNKSAGLDYWKNVLEGYDGNAEIVPIAKREHFEKNVDKAEIKLSEELSSRLLTLARANNVTVNSVVEAIWGIILQRFNNTNDIVFGKVVSGRNAPLIGIENIVGLFINTVPIRIKTDEKATILSLINDIQAQGVESSNYHYCSLSDIMSVTKKGSQLIKTLLTFENYFKHEIISEFRSDMVKSNEQTNYAISVNVSLSHNVLSFEIEYDTNIYESTEIERLFEYIEMIIYQFIEAPNLEIGKLELITEEERKKILGDFNNTYVEYDRSKTVVDLFEEQVERTPGNTAVVYEEESLTYEELNKKANQLARKLREMGVGPNDFVAMLAQRSIDMVIGIYGILKAGGAYVPIDPEYPEERIEYMLEDCRPKTVVVCGCSIETDLPVVDLSNGDFYAGVSTNLKKVNKPDDLIYCIYTSGTTGRPKGVMIEHRGLHNLIVAYTSIYDLSSKDTVLQAANYIFDQSVWDIFNILNVGGVLCLISRDDVRQPFAIEACCNKNHVTIASFTPAMLSELNPDEFSGLRILDSSGEAANAEVLKKWVKDRMVFNTYGPTEMTVNTSSYEYCGENIINIPIGNPAANTKYYVVDSNNNLCGIGIPGELCVSGEGMARGYLNNAKLTAEKFVKNPFGEGIMYKTGDLARWLANGNVECLGRFDDQVKIRGYRIELGEVENAIRKLEVIRDCAVVTKVDENGEKAIYAYMVSTQEIKVSEIREKLGASLPEYMIPAYMAQIESIPVTRSGKIDRNALPDIEKKSEEAYIAPETEEERVLCKVFYEILGVEKVGRNDNFFELGGDSIKSIRVVSKVREAGYELTVRNIMKKNVVKAIAQTMIRAGANRYDQGEIVGWIKPTPIIRDFGESNYAKAHYYNQSTVIRMNKRCRESTKKALYALVKHHDILRSVYRDKTLKILGLKESGYYDYYEIEAKGDNEKIKEECTKIQNSIDLENGPLVKAANISTEKGEYLFVCIHHLLVDGVSWRILTEDITNGIDQAEAGKEIVLPKKTASFKEWAESLEEYQKSKKLQTERSYWEKVIEGIGDGNIKVETTGEKGRGDLKIKFDQKTTKELLYQSGTAYNTEINDLLLVAIGMAAKEMTGQNKLTVMLEGHGREEIHKKIEIDRTVGWFTSEYPVILESGDDVQANIINTKEMLRKVPNHGMGYGLIKEEQKEISVLFNYMGEMDAERKADEMEELDIGYNVSEENKLDIPIGFNGEVLNGHLTFYISFDKSKYSKQTISMFATSYKRNLENVINICVSREEKIKTISDVSSEEIDLSDLNFINNILSN